MSGQPTGGHHPAVAWVVLRSDQLREGAVTVRWKRGHDKAHVLIGERVGEHGMARMLGEITVAREGWIDVAEIRSVGQSWLNRFLVRGRSA